MTAAMHRYPCAAGLWALLAILLCAPPAVGEPVVTLTDHGDPRALIDVVILGDGFTAEQMDTFHAKARVVRDGFLADPPLSNYAAFFNFHAIEVTSAESGADHPGRPADTALGAGYNCGRIERLVCVNGGRIEGVLNRSVDAAARDVILILVNDRQYGGSGGAYSVAYTGREMVPMMVHEFGHSFARLADEYVEEGRGRCTGREPRQPNVTFVTERADVKWNAGGGPPRGWIEPGTAVPTVDRNSGVGLYEGAYYCRHGVYRPTYSSRMRDGSRHWGPVNEEVIVKTIHRRTSVIAAVTPKTDARSWAAAGSRTFAATLVRPAPDTLSVEWRLNGTPVGTADSVSIDFEAAGVGDHVLELVVADTTAKVRNDPGGLLRHTRSWRFEIDADADADGMADGWEQRHGLSADDAADADADADGDGLSNLQEFLAGTNPTVVDTDRDGVGDGREVSEGADPAVADPWVTGFTLVAVDADGNGRDIGPLADAATVDLASVDGRVNIRADIAAGHASVVAARVEFDLTGPHTATRSEGLRPHALFGADRRGYNGGWLPNGEYTLTARSYPRQEGGKALSSPTVRFTVTGDFGASEPAVAGLHARGRRRIGGRGDWQGGGRLGAGRVGGAGAGEHPRRRAGESPGRGQRPAGTGWHGGVVADGRRAALRPVRGQGRQPRCRLAAERDLHADGDALDGAWRAGRGPGGDDGRLHGDGWPARGRAAGVGIHAGGRGRRRAGPRPRADRGRRHGGRRAGRRAGEHPRGPGQPHGHRRRPPGVDRPGVGDAAGAHLPPPAVAVRGRRRRRLRVRPGSRTARTRSRRRRTPRGEGAAMRCRRGRCRSR